MFRARALYGLPCPAPVEGVKQRMDVLIVYRVSVKASGSACDRTVLVAEAMVDLVVVQCRINTLPYLTKIVVL